MRRFFITGAKSETHKYKCLNWTLKLQIWQHGTWNEPISPEKWCFCSCFHHCRDQIHSTLNSEGISKIKAKGKGMGEPQNKRTIKNSVKWSKTQHLRITESCSIWPQDCRMTTHSDRSVQKDGMISKKIIIGQAWTKKIILTLKIKSEPQKQITSISEEIWGNWISVLKIWHHSTLSTQAVPKNGVFCYCYPDWSSLTSMFLGL